MLLSFYISFHSIGINGSLSECLFCVCVFYFVLTTKKFTFLFIVHTYFTDYKECVSHDSRPIILLSIHIWIYCANQICIILVAWYFFPKTKFHLIFILRIFNKQYFRINLFFGLVFGVLWSPKVTAHHQLNINYNDSFGPAGMTCKLYSSTSSSTSLNEGLYFIFRLLIRLPTGKFLETWNAL